MVKENSKVNLSSVQHENKNIFPLTRTLKIKEASSRQRPKIHFYEFLPLFPTPGAPTTATLTSDSEDFFLLTPLELIPNGTNGVQAKRFVKSAREYQTDRAITEMQRPSTHNPSSF